MTGDEVQDPVGPGAPSAWVREHGGRIAQDPGTVLDLACGKGRHTRHFLGLGYRVTALDRDSSNLSDIAGNPNLEVIEADLEAENTPWPLGSRTFAGVVVTNYLWRPILPAIIAAVAPGGVLIYETFAQGNERFGHPRNPDYLLRPSELKDAIAGHLDLIAFEHGEVKIPRPAVIQRICAVLPPGL